MNISDTASVASSDSSTSSPIPRQRPPALRLDHVGIDPQTLIGKTLKGLKRSPTHPTLTLDFTDNTTYQILVDGYNPLHPGVPKELEFDPLFQDLLDEGAGAGATLELTIIDCTLVTLSDRAFERRQKATGDPEDLRWDQKHLGVAFKFSGPVPRWYCVWAMLEDRDQAGGVCIFRSYDDVYLQALQRSPRKQRHYRTPSSSPKKQRTTNPWS